MSNSLPLGATVALLRDRLDLTQKAMANQLGITASYLNQIEHNKRPLSAELIVRLADTFNVDARTFSARPRMEAYDRLCEIIALPEFARLNLSKEELRSVAFTSPALVEGLHNTTSALEHARKKLSEAGLSLDHDDVAADMTNNSGRLTPIGSGNASLREAALATNLVDEIHLDHANQFGDIDAIADDYRREIGLAPHNRVSGLVRYLSTRHGISVEGATGGEVGDLPVWRDRYRNLIQYDRRVESVDLQWHLLLQVIKLDHAAFIESKVQATGPWSESGKLKARERFTEFFALACLMPYSELYNEAENCLYDLDHLRLSFSVSLEQLAIRLCYLTRPGQAAPPFFFFKLDCAGNILRRVFNEDFAGPLADSPCPLLHIHSSFRTPEVLITQVFEMPDERRFFLLARQSNSVYTKWPVRRAPTAICLGCNIEHAHRLAYTQGTNFGTAQPTYGGLNCANCSRTGCPSRAKNFG